MIWKYLKQNVFFSQRIWIWYNIELAESVHCFSALKMLPNYASSEIPLSSTWKILLQFSNEKSHCSKRTNIITLNFIMIVVSRHSIDFFYYLVCKKYASSYSLDEHKRRSKAYSKLSNCLKFQKRHWMNNNTIGDVEALEREAFFSRQCSKIPIQISLFQGNHGVQAKEIL